VFYVLRFLLGVAEAGFFPGIILYLTYWFRRSGAARMNALFMIGIPVAGVVGGPLSGWILTFHRTATTGWPGWQWLFLVEGVPSVVLGVCHAVLPARRHPRRFRWLERTTRNGCWKRISPENAGKAGSRAGAVSSATARVWLMALIYFCCVMGLYGVSFWLPTLIKNGRGQGCAGHRPADRHSLRLRRGRDAGRREKRDRTRERRWHFTVASALGGLGLVLATIYGNTVIWPWPR
jgi:MFS family permease